MTASLSRPARLAALTLSALATTGAVAAAGASAATLTADKACYVNTGSIAPVTLSGQGFTPGDEVAISGGDFSADATADPTGAFAVTAPAPMLAPGPRSQAFALTATDITTPGPATATTIHVANLAAAVSSKEVRNVRKDKVTFTFSGFVPGKPIYGYFVHKKSVTRDRFSRATGPCGTLRQRALLFPGGRPHSNAYKVTFEDTTRYSASAFPRVTGNLTILHFLKPAQ